MDEDYFSDQPDGAGDQPMEKDHKEEGEQTALLPKSILMGKDFKVNDEIVLKIDAIREDEIEVSYASEPEKKSEKMPDNAEAPMKNDNEMSSLYS